MSERGTGQGCWSLPVIHILLRANWGLRYKVFWPYKEVLNSDIQNLCLTSSPLHPQHASKTASLLRPGTKQSVTTGLMSPGSRLQGSRSHSSLFLFLRIRSEVREVTQKWLLELENEVRCFLAASK